MALQRSPVAALLCAGSQGQDAFVPLWHLDYKCGHQGRLKLREKLGKFIDMGLLSHVDNNGQVKLGRKDTSQQPGSPSFWTHGSPAIQWTMNKIPHIICHLGCIFAVTEYKDLFITASAHITDRLNHFLAVKMTVAQ